MMVVDFLPVLCLFRLARDAGIASFNVSHAPRDRFLVSYTFCSCLGAASVRNAVQRDGRGGAHGLGR